MRENKIVCKRAEVNDNNYEGKLSSGHGENKNEWRVITFQQEENQNFDFVARICGKLLCRTQAGDDTMDSVWSMWEVHNPVSTLTWRYMKYDHIFICTSNCVIDH